MGQSLWALVNRSGNKKDRRNLEKLSVLLTSSFRSALGGGCYFIITCPRFVGNRLKPTSGEKSSQALLLLGPLGGNYLPICLSPHFHNSSPHVPALF